MVHDVRERDVCGVGCVCVGCVWCGCVELQEYVCGTGVCVYIYMVFVLVCVVFIWRCVADCVLHLEKALTCITISNTCMHFTVITVLLSELYCFYIWTYVKASESEMGCLQGALQYIAACVSTCLTTRQPFLSLNQLVLLVLGTVMRLAEIDMNYYH